MIRAIFSADDNKLSFSLPQSWDELSQDELAMVFRSLQRNPSSEQARLAILLHLTGMSIICREATRWRCKVRAVCSGKDTTISFLIDREKMAWMIEQLEWVQRPGNIPVRLDELRHRWHSYSALNAAFHGVPFKTYLIGENCYQGVLMSRSMGAISQLAGVLYPGITRALEEWEQLMIIQWWAQLKEMFAQLFPVFFKPGGGTEPDMRSIMDNQIRALTGGDITKENEVLEMDTWRALTELNAKAQEAEDFKKSSKK